MRRGFWVLAVAIVVVTVVSHAPWCGKTPRSIVGGEMTCMITREATRTGNLLYRHVFWRMMTMQHGTGLYDFTSRRLTSPPFRLDVFSWSWRKRDLGWQVWANKRYTIDYADQSPHDFRLYRRHRGMIRNEILHATPCSPIEYDLAVHVRLDDVFNDHPPYSLLPLSFYRAALRNVPRPCSTVAVIARPISELQKVILNDIARLIQAELGENASMDVFTDSRIEDDLCRLMSARVLIASVSTFWPWPSFMSTRQTDVHVPAFGAVQRMHYLDSTDRNDVLVFHPKDNHTSVSTWSDDGSTYTVHVYPVPGLARGKIMEGEVERMYD